VYITPHSQQTWNFSTAWGWNAAGWGALPWGHGSVSKEGSACMERMQEQCLSFDVMLGADLTFQIGRASFQHPQH